MARTLRDVTFKIIFKNAGSVLITHNAVFNVGNNDSYTVAAWCKFVEVRDQSLTEKWSNGGTIDQYPWAMRALGGVTKAIYDGSANPGAPTGGALNNGAPHHVVLVRDFANDRLIGYNDGVTTGQTTDSTDGNVSTDKDIRIGARNATGQRYTGKAKDFYLFDGALDATEVLNLYNGILPDNTMLLGMPMNEDEGATCYDASGNGNNGAFTNLVQWNHTISRIPVSRILSLNRQLIT